MVKSSDPSHRLGPGGVRADSQVRTKTSQRHFQDSIISSLGFRPHIHRILSCSSLSSNFSDRPHGGILRPRLSSKQWLLLDLREKYGCAVVTELMSNDWLTRMNENGGRVEGADRVTYAHATTWGRYSQK
jgi:hypothetical protein